MLNIWTKTCVYNHIWINWWAKQPYTLSTSATNTMKMLFTTLIYTRRLSSRISTFLYRYTHTHTRHYTTLSSHVLFTIYSTIWYAIRHLPPRTHPHTHTHTPLNAMHKPIRANAAEESERRNDAATRDRNFVTFRADTTYRIMLHNKHTQGKLVRLKSGALDGKIWKCSARDAEKCMPNKKWIKKM